MSGPDVRQTCHMAEALGSPGPMPTTTAVFCKTIFAFAFFDVLCFKALYTYLPGYLVKQVPYGLPHSMHSMKACILCHRRI